MMEMSGVLLDVLSILWCIFTRSFPLKSSANTGLFSMIFLLTVCLIVYFLYSKGRLLFLTSGLESFGCHFISL
jgi:hypothetical protein